MRLIIPQELFSKQNANIIISDLNIRKWLPPEQVSILNQLYHTTNDIGVVLHKAHTLMLGTYGDLRELALESFKKTCKDLLQAVMGSAGRELIEKMYKFNESETEIISELKEFHTNLSDTSRKYADMVTPVCLPIQKSNPNQTSIPQLLKTTDGNASFAKIIHWLTEKQQAEIGTMLARGEQNSQILAKISSYIENFDSVTKENMTEDLKQLCQNRVEDLFGVDGLALLKTMYQQLGSVELLIAKYTQLVGNLKSEDLRNEADQVRIFCQKVYKVKKFDLADLTTWLTADQKLELGDLIQNYEVSDGAVYEHIFEFYEKANSERKLLAEKIIQSSCKRFIFRMFGDEIATKLQERKLDGNYSAQMLSAELAMYAAEIKDDKNRIKAEKSIPICNRIYFGYKGDCFCNGHSSVCNPLTYQCVNCADNTFGVQCEKCIDGFEGDAKLGEKGCIVNGIDIEDKKCVCNKHSSKCDENDRCLDCLHNTIGNNCENCMQGFYGDATQGTLEDCNPCPCPNGGECFINSDALVECRECPIGTLGVTCELQVPQTETTTAVVEVTK
ncbi:unnamed protein product [Thelazia callipaeda]|uniref:Laminin EGF-like domain-containing protein n=1 Tax=Thelazia callipaeda TaxID=103827 RepID=A0A0N5CQS6_THECL|nr:unnamed protein product [Thelazia callipaeda]